MKKVFLILISIFLFSSCEMPFGSSAPLKYNKEHNQQILSLHGEQCKKEEQQEDCEHCNQKLEGVTPKFLNDMNKALAGVSCSKICPLCANKLFNELPDYVKNRGYINLPNNDGICRGHAITSQQFNMLGIFCKRVQPSSESCNNYSNQNSDEGLATILADSKKQCALTEKSMAKCNKDGDEKYDASCENDISSSKCKKYYNEIIKDITNNKLRAIPGFSSLAEFSKHPIYNGVFKQKVDDASRSLLADGSLGKRGKFSAGRAHFTEVGEDTKDSMATRYKEIMSRVENYNEVPYIGFDYPGKYFRTYKHAVTAYKVEKVPGVAEKVLCIRDPNYSNRNQQNEGTDVTPEKCEDNYMTLDSKTGKVKYFRRDRSNGKLSNVNVKAFKIYDEEDGRNVDYAKQHENSCKRVSKCLDNEEGQEASVTAQNR